MTAIVNDFAAIRAAIDPALAVDARGAADQAWFALPGKERHAIACPRRLSEHGLRLSEQCLPEPFGGLYREAGRLEEKAGELFDQIAKMVPTTLAGAIDLLEKYGEHPGIHNNAVEGLRSIAAANASSTAADDEILFHFRAWIKGRRDAWPIEDEHEFDEKLKKNADPHDEAIFAIPAAGVVGVAIKLFIKTLILDGGYLTQGDPNKLDAAALADGGWSKSIFRDLVRPVPELAPFCTEALAGGAQS